MLSSQNLVNTDDSEMLEQVISNEYSQVQAVMQRSSLTELTIAPLQYQDEPTTLKGMFSFDKLDFDVLIDMRRRHQTKQAAQGVRTKLTKSTDEDKSTHLRMKILREMHSALKESQDEAAAGTGLDRRLRWRAPAPGGRNGLIEGVSAPALPAGSSANAAVSADAVAKAVSIYPFR